MLCRECGKTHRTDNKTFCPKCLVKCDKRNEFREIMNSLQKINDLPDRDGTFMWGFSNAEMERFSLIFRKTQKRYHFPLDFDDFVNPSSIKTARELYISDYNQKLDNALSSPDKGSLYKIRQKLEKKYPAGWDKSTLSDVLVFCINKGAQALESKGK